MHGPSSVSTSSLDSLTDSDNQEAVRSDVDEASWEEAETALRRHTRLTVNFFLTTSAGAIIVTAGLAASSSVTEATALVAAAIIAPVFEPLARIGLGAVNRHYPHGTARDLLRAAWVRHPDHRVAPDNARVPRRRARIRR